MPGSNLPPRTQKRKWKADNIVKIDLGEDSDEEIATVNVQQASHDGRRFGRKLHSVPLPREPSITVAASGLPEDIDFRVDVVGEDGEDCDKGEKSVVAVRASRLCPVRPELIPTVGRTVTNLG